MKISIIGAGYVGLSLALLISRKYHVNLLDTDQKKISLLKKKISPIKDSEIKKFLKLKNINFNPTSDKKEAIENSYITIIATPTNYDLKRLFLSADKDKDEALSFNEWENILSKHRSGVSFSLDDVKSLFLLVNESKNGYISWKEFLNFVDPNAVVKQSSTNYNSGANKTSNADTNTKFAT